MEPRYFLEYLVWPFGYVPFDALRPEFTNAAGQGFPRSAQLEWGLWLFGAGSRTSTYVS